MSIGRAIAEYIARAEAPNLIVKGKLESAPTPILPEGIQSLYPDVVSFVDQELERSAQFRDTRREGLAYGIVSDILAPRYGGEAMLASVVLDFANRADVREIDLGLDQEKRFEATFSAILNQVSSLHNDMRNIYAYGKLNEDTGEYTDEAMHYKVSSLQVTDSARILISAGFMRGYIIVDVGYTLGVNDGKG